MTFKDGNPGVTKSGRMAVWHDVKDSGHDYSHWRYLDGTNVPKGVEVRPHVMLDLKDREALEDLWIASGTHFDHFCAALRDLVTPKPPKPAEPTGRLAVVIDDDSKGWSLDSTLDDTPWFCRDSGTWGTWDDIPITSPDQIKFAGLS